MLPDGSAPSSRSCESTNGLAQVNPNRRQNLWPNAQEPPEGSDPRRSLAFSPSAAALAPGADWASFAPNRGRGEANCADCGEHPATVSFPHGRGRIGNGGRCGSGLQRVNNDREDNQSRYRIKQKTGLKGGSVRANVVQTDKSERPPWNRHVTLPTVPQ